MASEEHLIDLLPAYALGSLDEEETTLVADHLAECARCRADLAGYEEVMGALAFTVPELAPPPRLKARLMAEVQASGGRAVHSASTMERLQAFFYGAAPVWGLVSLVLIVALFVSNLLLQQRVSELETVDPRAMASVVLQGTDAAPEATGTMVVGRDGVVGTLVVDGLPTLEESLAYQLWLIDEDGSRESAGTFSVNDNGYGRLYIHAPRPVLTFSGLGVTIEPAEGSPQPTGEKVLGVEL